MITTIKISKEILKKLKKEKNQLGLRSYNDVLVYCLNKVKNEAVNYKRKSTRDS